LRTVDYSIIVTTKKEKGKESNTGLTTIVSIDANRPLTCKGWDEEGSLIKDKVYHNGEKITTEDL